MKIRQPQRSIINLLEVANFPQAFLSWLSHNFNHYESQFDEPLQEVFASELSISDQDKLFECLLLLLPLKVFYQRRSISDEIFSDSIYDLNYRISRYYNENQSYGLYQRDLYWLSFLFRGEIFDLGSLRFQRFKFSYAEIERQAHERMELSDYYKAKFKEGINVINIHIMNNADLSEVAVTDSLKIAKRFFKTHFEEMDYEVYVCRTWLLYDGLKAILPADSNIISFQKHFKIIASHNFPNQALNRIYGTTDLNLIETMDKPSRLQQKAYLNLEHLGVSAGIIYKEDIED